MVNPHKDNMDTDDDDNKNEDNDPNNTHHKTYAEIPKMTNNEIKIRRDLMVVIDGRMRLVEENLKKNVQEIEGRLETMEKNIKKDAEETKELITHLLESVQNQEYNTSSKETNDQHKGKENPRPWLKLNLKRFDHVLTQETSYPLWRDKIRAEILANDCLCVFEKDGLSRGKYNETDLNSMRYCVRSFIIGHLGSFHHSLVQYTQDPIEMMKMLDQAGQPLDTFGEFDLTDRLNHLKFEASETVLEFLQRFEELIVQLRRYVTYTDDQARKSLVLAIRTAMPDVYQRITNQAPPGPTLNEIKTMMYYSQDLKNAANKKAEQESSALCNTSKTWNENSTNKNRQTKTKNFHKGSLKNAAKTAIPCGKCGVNGHQRESCPNKGWKCYCCQKFTTSHYSKNCPNKESSANKSSNSGSKKKNFVKRLGGKANSDKHKGMTKIPISKARKALRASNGHARLTIHADSDTEDFPMSERCVWVDSNEFDYDAADLLYADANASDGGSDTALACFDGKPCLPSVIRFIADSGATDHIVNNEKYLTNVVELSKERRITCANADRNADLVIKSMGDIMVRNGETGKISCLRNVLCAPGLVENLFSIRKVVSFGLNVVFTASKLLIKDSNSGEVITSGKFCGRFWWLSFSLPLFDANPQMVQSAQIMLGKLRMGGRLTDTFNGRHPLLAEATCSSLRVQRHKDKDNDKDKDNGDKERPHKDNEHQALKNHSIPHKPFGTKDSVNTKGGSFPMSLLGKRHRCSLSQPIAAAVEEPSSKREKTKQGSSVSEIDEEDLEQLNSQRTHSLRDCVGYLWHLRLNHASLSYLRIAAKTIPELKGVTFGNDILDCEFCKMAKGKHKACSEERQRSKVPFSRLWSDLMGPIKPMALRTKAKYIVTFSDDCTRYAMAYTLNEKTRVHIALQNCLQEIRQLTQREPNVIEICTDGGKEYQTQEIKTIMNKNRITLKICEPATPQHNACAERLNLELQEKMRACLFAAKMPNYYWNHALNHVVHIHNRTPNRSNSAFKSPYEMVKGIPPKLKYIKRFGCAAYYLDVHAKEKSKFAQRSNLAILLECNDTGYTLLDANKAVITRSKNVEFVESKVYGNFYGSDATLPINEDLSFRENIVQQPSNSIDVVESGEISRPTDNEESPNNNTEPESVAEENASGERIIGSTDQYEFYETDETVDDLNDHDNETNLASLLQAVVSEMEDDPVTYNEALARPDSAQWIEAINDEFTALYKCKTWRIVPKYQVPDNLKIIKARWVHRRKQEVNGTTRYRSRLVAKGFADNNQYDRTEIYAPVARLADVRFMLIVANKLDLELVQFDVRTAFLNGKLNKPVFMSVPEGLTEYLGENNEFCQKYVCELKRALYGLKVSPKCWFVRFQTAMEKLGFVPYEFQQCIFTWKEGKDFALLLLYVDDILVATNSKEKLKRVTKELKQEFEITELGEPRKFLGLEICRDRRRNLLFLHQQKFTERIIQKYHSSNRKPVSSPMVPFDQREHSTKKALSPDERKKIPYRRVIGSLLYLQNGTRPDIAYATNIMSRRQSNFDLDDWNRVQRIMTYLEGTTEMGLLYEGKGDKIECFVDASLGTNDPNGYSTSGLIIKLFGDIIYWKTKKQHHVALSTAESEHVALSLACRELTNVRALSKNLIGKSLIPTIYEDSVAAIELAKTDESSTLKHLVYLHYHYVRSEVRQKLVNIQWISTSQQLADILTKALEPAKFMGFRDKIMDEPHNGNRALCGFQDDYNNER